LLGRADCCGRICDNKKESLERLGMFADYCIENHCYDRPYDFRSGEQRFRYLFEYASIHADYSEPNWSHVTLFSGLPASGKDWYYKKNLGSLPSLSLDDIREEMDVDPADLQGGVIQMAKERAREFLRAKKDFVFNATNLSRELRRQWIQLCRDYHAKVDIVYVERPFEQLLMYNKKRQRVVPEAVISRLIDRMEPPTLAECYEMEVYLND
jgi:predicted kinase